MDIAKSTVKLKTYYKYSSSFCEKLYYEFNFYHLINNDDIIEPKFYFKMYVHFLYHVTCNPNPLDQMHPKNSNYFRNGYTWC